MPFLFELSAYTWNQHTILHGLAGIVILIMGLSTVYRERGTRIGRLYLYYTLSLATWVGAHALMLSTSDRMIAEIWFRLASAAIVFIPALFLHLSTLLLNLKWIPERLITVAWSISAFLSLSALSSYYYIDEMRQFSWGLYGHFGPIGLGFLVYFSILIAFAIYQYFPACKRAQPGSILKKRAIILLVAFFIGLLGAIDFLPALGIDIHPSGYQPIFLMFVITTYVTWRYRLVDITAEFAADNLLNIIKSPIIVLDREGDIRLTNEAANSFIKLVGKSKVLDNLLLLIEKNYKKEEQDLIPHTIENIECELTLLEQPHYYQLSISPLLSIQNTLLAYVCLLQDITERVHSQKLLQTARDELDERVRQRTEELKSEVSKHKQTTEALRTAKNYAEDASKAKTEFLSRISHELRTPLNAMLGFTQLLQLDIDQIPQQEHRQYIEQMQKSGEHLLELIEDILDLSQIEMGKLSIKIEKVDVYEVITEAIRICQHMADAHGVTIHNDITEQNKYLVMADSTRLKQIMINMLTNAIKYNSENGRVDISLEFNKEKTRILVTDTGCGIADEQRSHVFEPFERIGNWRHHTEGAGIGLALSYKLALEMKGDLNFSSEPGKGSTFWVDIPTA